MTYRIFSAIIESKKIRNYFKYFWAWDWCWHLDKNESWWWSTIRYTSTAYEDFKNDNMRFEISKPQTYSIITYHATPTNTSSPSSEPRPYPISIISLWSTIISSDTIILFDRRKLQVNSVSDFKQLLSLNAPPSVATY
jgi:hypothetical protein